MTTKTFTKIGIANPNGITKVRFTNDLVRRVKIFNVLGASRCDFISLPEEMTKIDALKYMLTDPLFASPADQATISDSIADKEKDWGKNSGLKVNLSLDAILERSKARQSDDSEVLESVLKAAVS